MLDSLLPHYTYRRLAMRFAFNWLRGRDSLWPRLNRRNYNHFVECRASRLNCNVCEAVGEPFFDFPDLKLRRAHRIGELRETIQCKCCGATMRHRTLAAMLLRSVTRKTGRRFASLKALANAGLGGLTVLDADAFSPNSKVLRAVPGYTVSSFVPDKPFDAELAPGHVNLNLEKMGFAADTFDVVLTSDVMEHVRGIDAAHKEIARVLKPTGHYLFTVPYEATSAPHIALVDTSGSEDVFLVPPHYHGDPLTGGILAYRIFGRKIFDDLAACGLKAEFTCIDDAEALIEKGDAFIAEKSDSAACPMPTHNQTSRRP